MANTLDWPWNASRGFALFAAELSSGNAYEISIRACAASLQLRRIVYLEKIPERTGNFHDTRWNVKDTPGGWFRFPRIIGLLFLVSLKSSNRAVELSVEPERCLYPVVAIYPVGRCISNEMRDAG